MLKLIGLFFLVLILIHVPTAAQDEPTWVVNSLLDDPRGCPENCTLRSAIASAAPGDVIGFSSDLTGTIALVQALSIDKSLTIAGPGADKIAIILNKGVEDYTVIINADDVTVSGLTFRHGFGIYVKAQNAQLSNMVFASNEKSAIYIEASSLLVENSLFENNAGQSGGGLSISEYNPSQVVVLNSVFRHNKASEGGGAIFCNSGMLLVDGSTFEANEGGVSGGAIKAGCNTEVRNSHFTQNRVRGIGIDLWSGAERPSGGYGGAIAHIYGEPLVIKNSVFTENSNVPMSKEASQFPFYGGAVYVEEGFEISGSSFVGNQSQLGGALYNQTPVSSTSITNSTFVNNAADEQGGAIYSSGVTLLHTTITGNQAKAGGGVFIAETTTTTIGSSLIADNTAPQGADVLGVVDSYGYNLIGKSAGNSGWFASDQRDVAPLLGDLGDYGGGLPTIPLQEGSPGIAAVGSDCPETDQRGVPRTAPCDVGAFELTDAPVVAAQATPILENTQAATIAFQTVDVLPTAAIAGVDTTSGSVETSVAATVAALQPASSTDAATPDVIGSAVAATVAAMQVPAATPTATLTPDMIATYVAATLTMVAPAPTIPNTPLPTAMPAATTLPDGVLFEDDFTSDRGWSTLDAGEGGAAVEDGGLFMYSVNRGASPVVPIPGVTIDPQNFSIEIETFFMPTASDQYIGFALGDFDAGQYMSFAVGDIWDYWNFQYAQRSTGDKDDGWAPILNKALPGGLMDYNAPLNLRLEANDGMVRLYVNGKALPSVVYNRKSAQIGLVIINGGCCGSAGMMPVSHIRVTETHLSDAEVQQAASFYADYMSAFEQPAPYWTFSNEYGSGSIVDGMMRLKPSADGAIVWNYVPNFDSETVVFGVDISSQAYGEFNCGVLFNYENTDEFYHLNIGNNGFYSLWSRYHGDIVPLVDWKADSRIVRPSSSVNRIGVAIQAGAIEVYFNGLLFNRIYDDDHRGGRVALVAESYGQANDPACDFDNLVVSDNPYAIEQMIGGTGQVYTMP